MNIGKLESPSHAEALQAQIDVLIQAQESLQGAMEMADGLYKLRNQAASDILQNFSIGSKVTLGKIADFKGDNTEFRVVGGGEGYIEVGPLLLTTGSNTIRLSPLEFALRVAGIWGEHQTKEKA